MAPENPVFMKVGDWIASGKYADIHELDDGRVIRFARCSSYDWKPYSIMLSRLQKRPHPSIVDVHEFAKLGQLQHEEFPGEFWVYYYTITEKLTPITDELEGEAVCEIIDETLNGELELLPGEQPVDLSVIPFHKADRLRKTFRDFPYTHLDLHWGNVMKDGKGNYKLIDLDSLE